MTMVADKDYKQALKSIQNEINLILAHAVDNSISRKIAMLAYEHEKNDSSIFPLSLSNEEIALKLGISKGTVAASIYAAKKAKIITVVGGGKSRLIKLNTKTIADIRDTLLSVE